MVNLISSFALSERNAPGDAPTAFPRTSAGLMYEEPCPVEPAELERRDLVAELILLWNGEHQTQHLCIQRSFFSSTSNLCISSIIPCQALHRWTQQHLNGSLSEKDAREESVKLNQPATRKFQADSNPTKSFTLLFTLLQVNEGHGHMPGALSF